MGKKHTRRKHCRRRSQKRGKRRTKQRKRRQRRKTHRQSGGGAGLVGSPWLPSSVSSWENGTYYPYNPYAGVGGATLPISTRIIPSMKGGGKRRRQTRKQQKVQRGGGMFWAVDDLVNVGREIEGGAKNLYNTYSGKTANLSPLPYKDQLGGNHNAHINDNSLKNAYNTAGSLVASI
jgi:hypothetical protein